MKFRREEKLVSAWDTSCDYQDKVVLWRDLEKTFSSETSSMNFVLGFI